MCVRDRVNRQLAMLAMRATVSMDGDRVDVEVCLRSSSDLGGLRESTSKISTPP